MIREQVGRVLMLVVGLALAGLTVILALPGVGRADQAVPMAGPIYVDADATGGNTGSSWLDAYTELQSALAAAGPGTEIWVAEGVYTPDYNPIAGSHTGSVSATFVLTNGVTLYGGFAGGEGSLDQRDWESHVTVLSGDLAGDDATDPQGVVVTATNIVGPNSWTVVTADGVTETAVLDGFVVTGGQSAGSGGEWWHRHRVGGGMYNINSSATVRHVTFSGNSAGEGGGMFNRDSYPILTDVTLSGNMAARYGGGMTNSEGHPTLTGATFSGNYAGYSGGGMANFGHSDIECISVTESDPILIDVIFEDNVAVFNGGGIYSRADSIPTLFDVTFVGNSAQHGGGMAGHCGAAAFLTDVTFRANHASGNGGGMWHYEFRVDLKNVIFEGNTADSHGGGLFIGGENYIGLTNVVFSGNSAVNNGGGLANWLPPDGYYIGILELVNITFSGNSANYGGGLYNYENDPTLSNCIFWGNTAVVSGTQIYNSSASTPTISYSDVQGGCPPYASCNDLVDVDPLFERNPNPGDGDWTTLADNDYGDLRLRSGSPAIDAGDNAAIPSGVTTDLDGNPRIMVDVVDMGAYEFFKCRVSLPLVLKNHLAAPDLVVERILATANDVQVVIGNQGSVPVINDFWVDVYLDPNPVPTQVNQIWSGLSDQGLAWGVTANLAPGEVLTLTIGGAYYSTEYSLVEWPLQGGAHIYAQVDSANTETTYGAVLESHEITGGAYNNVAGPEGVIGSRVSVQR